MEQMETMSAHINHVVTNETFYLCFTSMIFSFFLFSTFALLAPEFVFGPIANQNEWHYFEIQ